MRVDLVDGDECVLQQRIRRERRTLARDRFQVVLLADQGREGPEQTREQIAEAVGRSRQIVDEWVGR